MPKPRKSTDEDWVVVVRRDRGPKMSDPKLERRESAGLELLLRRIELGGWSDILEKCKTEKANKIYSIAQVSTFVFDERPALKGEIL